MQRRVGGVRLVLALIWLLSMLLQATPLAATSALPTAAISGVPSSHAPMAPLANGIVVEPQLQAQIEAEGSASYLIYFRDRPDLAAAAAMSWHDRGWFVYKALRDTADRSQGRVRAYLEKQGVKYRAFWIDNVIAVERSGRVVLNGLLNFPEIASLRATRTLKLIEPIKAKVAPTAVQAIEPNIAHVGAPTAWAQGITGQGIVVASIDTGVRYSHQALVGHYRGNLGNGAFDHNYNWWDPYGDHPGAPADDNGHGTHTMGTMVGSDGGPNQIGMAPGAQWIACRGCSTSNCADAALLECAQFMVAPWDLSHNNPNPDRRPHVVNNSWGDCATTYDGWFQGVIDAWHAAGVYPVFSNGNSSNCGYSSPPPCGTVGNPARYGNVTGVGSTGRDDGRYASHSNRGPTDHPDTVNPREFPTIKPQVAAPGINIRSSIPDDDAAYAGGWTGTSMSAPHVGGLVALIWQAAPCLRGNYAATETLIEQTATPITTRLPGACRGEGPEQLPNQSTGWGEINAAAAVQAALQACGDSMLTGRVTEAATLQAAGDPIPHAVVQAWQDPADVRTTNVDARGYYTLTVFSGVYTVTAQAYGYLPAQVSSVVVAARSITTQNLALAPAPRHTVSGRVVDARTGWPLYARVAARGVPFGPPAPADSVWTDPVTGLYSITLAQGPMYTLEARAWVGGYTQMQRSLSTLTSDRAEEFALEADATCAAPGYRLDLVYEEDFEADNGSFTTIGNASWAWGAPTSGPGAAHSGTNVWATNLNGSYGNDENGALVSPIIDLSAHPGLAPTLFWQQWLSTEQGYDFAQVEASSDGGATWETVYGPVSGGVSLRWSRVDIPLPATYATDAFRFRFSFRSDYSIQAAGWYVDDVAVTMREPSLPELPCLTPDGGLVVGNVVDANTGAAVAGASVAVDGKRAAVSATTPAGFFTLYAPTGLRRIVASKPPAYGEASADVNVPAGGAVRQDLALPAGRLVTQPSALQATVQLRGSAVIPLTVSNSGGRTATFAIAETLTTVIGLFPSNTEIDAPAFATSADIPWLSVAPITATIAPGAQRTILVSFDASAISSPGKYEAALQLNSDTPYAPLTVPVTLIVCDLARKLHLPFIGKP